MVVSVIPVGAIIRRMVLKRLLGGGVSEHEENTPQLERQAHGRSVYQQRLLTAVELRTRLKSTTFNDIDWDYLKSDRGSE